MEVILYLANKYHISLNDIKEIEEYLYHNEWGIAFEILCTVFEIQQISISKVDYDIIKSIGNQMHICSELYINIIHK